MSRTPVSVDGDTTSGYEAAAISVPAAAHPNALPEQPEASGPSMPDRVRVKMERALGADFSKVKIHANSPQAAKLDARAYTQGNDIHFSARAYRPFTRSGQELLAHELAHVVQQRQGNVKPSIEVNHRPINDDPALETEADSIGRSVSTGQFNIRSALPRAHSLGSAGITGPQSQPVIQRVGGVKFGIREAEREGLRDSEAYQAFAQIVNTYKQEKKDEKAQATQRFNTGSTADTSRQDTYSDELHAAETNIVELKRRVNEHEALSVGDDNIVKDKSTNQEVARILTGNAAYAITKQVGTATAELGQVQDVYRKHSLGGFTNKEYIEAQGRKVRRFAQRGITPPEKRQIRQGGDVLPVFHTLADRQQNQTGIHYPENRAAFPRPATKLIGPPEARRRVNTGDLDFLHDVAGVRRSLTQIPVAALPFVQERKGVSKSFSATATSAQITSNHGAGFGTFGSVTIDLAKVDPNDILEHYANKGTVPLSSGIPATDIVDQAAMQREELRAGRTALRNREIHLSKYPATAVVGGVQDSPGVAAYKGAYRTAYDNAYDDAYEEGYTRGYGNSRGSGDNYLKRAERRSDYIFADNGTGANTGSSHGRDDGDQHGYEDGRRHGELDNGKRRK